MGFLTLEEVEKKRRRKIRYYKKKKAEGAVLYGADKSMRLMNKKEVKGFQRGFSRYSANQRGQVKAKTLIARRKKQKPYICYYKQGYIHTSIINDAFKRKDFHSIVEILYKTYSDIETVIDDYLWGYRDMLFTRFISISNLFCSTDKMQFFKDNYLEIFTDAILAIYDKNHLHIPKAGFSFFTFTVNIVAFELHTLLNRRYIKHLKYSAVNIDDVDIVSTKFPYSPLAIHVLNGFVGSSQRDPRDH